jgi:hypothetical protein
MLQNLMRLDGKIVYPNAMQCKDQYPCMRPGLVTNRIQCSQPQSAEEAGGTSGNRPQRSAE